MNQRGSQQRMFVNPCFNALAFHMTITERQAQVETPGCDIYVKLTVRLRNSFRPDLDAVQQDTRTRTSTRWFWPPEPKPQVKRTRTVLLIRSCKWNHWQILLIVISRVNRTHSCRSVHEHGLWSQPDGVNPQSLFFFHFGFAHKRVVINWTNMNLTDRRRLGGDCGGWSRVYGRKRSIGSSWHWSGPGVWWTMELALFVSVCPVGKSVSAHRKLKSHDSQDDSGSSVQNKWHSTHSTYSTYSTHSTHSALRKTCTGLKSNHVSKTSEMKTQFLLSY